MNKKTLAAITAIVLAASIGTAVGYQTFYELSNVHIDNSNVTLGENVTITNPPTPQPEQPKPSDHKAEPTPTPKTLPYSYVVYEFTLKAEYINNAEWIYNYDSQKTWLQNYITFLESMHGYPEQARDSIAAMMLARKLCESSEVNIETGRTKYVAVLFYGGGSVKRLF